MIGATRVVEDLSLRVTRLRATDGSVWYVPNGEIRQLSNASRGWAKAVVAHLAAAGLWPYVLAAGPGLTATRSFPVASGSGRGEPG